MKSDTTTIPKEFSPDEYDLYHVGVSGGKDSTAVILWCLFLSGWKRSKFIFSFADTGNEDALTYAYLDMLRQSLEVEISVIKPEHDFYGLARHKTRFPSARSRFCTESLKVVPSVNKVMALCEDANVLVLSGIRNSEGREHNDRGQLEVFGYNDLYGCDQYLPVYNYTLEEIWELHQTHLDIEDVIGIVNSDDRLTSVHKDELVGKMRIRGVPANPLYYMGAKRVGCFPCINSEKREMRAMTKFRPHRIDEIRAEESAVAQAFLAKESNQGFIENFGVYQTFITLNESNEKHYRTHEQLKDECQIANLRKRLKGFVSVESRLKHASILFDCPLAKVEEIYRSHIEWIKVNFNKTMFHRDTVTTRFWDIPIILKSGEIEQGVSIDGVALWSQTSRGGKQFEMDLGDFREGVISCDIRGMCE